MPRPDRYGNHARRSFGFARLTKQPFFREVIFLLCLFVIFSVTAPQIQIEFPPLASHARAQSPDPADAVCPRFAPGSVVSPPPDLYSQNGVLTVNLTFQTTVDEQGLTRYCFIANGSTALEAPTLHVNPGDQLIINFVNDLPAVAPSSQTTEVKRVGGRVRTISHPFCGIPPKPTITPAVVHAASPQPQSSGSGDCPGNGIITASTTNLHFHGTNVAPTCGQDDVIHTMIQSGDTFTYNVQIPTDEPPGLYWYHPHPHGFSEGQVQGGAAGALIVEGIQNVNTSLANLPQRLFVVRDQLLPNSESNDANIPAWDISLNYVPVPYPNYTPAVVQTPAGEQEFWRVLNAAADTILNVQYVVNGVAQPVQVVAMDGYPIGAGVQGAPQSETETSLLLGPGARAEFVVTTPNVSDQAQLVTQYWNTGPDGDSDPARPIANIVAQAAPQPSVRRLPSVVHAQKVTRFADLVDETPVAQRTIQFSEVLEDPSNPLSPTTFFITPAGQTPTAYYAGEPPSIVVHQGTVEDWTIQNTASEDHIFHIHQLHFQVLAINGQPVDDPAIRDTIDLPYWSGSSSYPSATLRMDFRDPSIVGTFVYHCHILEHEDGGMMNTIQVLPAGIATTTAISASSTDLNVNSSVTLTATVTAATSGGPALTGTVQFADEGNLIGSAVPLSNGQAAFTTTLSTSGNHSFTALYSGDVNYDQSASSALAVGAEDFSLTATAAAISQPGQSGTATITVDDSANFTAPVNFTCALPNSLTEAACFVNPNTLTGSGQVTLTVNTTPPHALVAPNVSVPPNPRITQIGPGVAALLLAFLVLWIPSRKWRVPAMFALVLVAFSLFAVGCGGSAKKDPGTPTGSYNTVVTATSGSGSTEIQHTVVVPLSVQ